MVVTATSTHGTIGGGNLEHVAIGQARALLREAPGQWRVQDYPLGPLLGQCCGGRVRLLLEHLTLDDAAWIERAHRLLRDGDSFTLSTKFEPETLQRDFSGLGVPASARGPRPVAGDRILEQFVNELPRVLLFGYGHVGAALQRLLSTLPFRVDVFDTRAEFAEEAEVTLVSEAGAESVASVVSPDDFVLVMTHDHALDYRLTLAGLRAAPRFVGLIGSATKRARFLRRLREAEVGAPALARLCCPIGMPGVDGKQPDVIAVAVAAQLLALRGEKIAGPSLIRQPASETAHPCLVHTAHH
jgi:xanthine dehydrogenase accessory factor